MDKDEQKLRDIMKTNLPFVFSNKYVIHKKSDSRIAVRISLRKDNNIISPFQRIKNTESQWATSKSVSCVNGIFAVPYERYSLENLYEMYFQPFYEFPFPDVYFTLLEYSDDDIIWMPPIRPSSICFSKKYPCNEIVLKRCNIVYSADGMNYIENYKKTYEHFLDELENSKENTISEEVSWNLAEVLQVRNLFVEDAEEYITFCQKHSPEIFYSYSNGIMHWLRTARYSLFVAEEDWTKADLRVLLWFALLHDSQKEKEFHGVKAFQYIDEIKDTFLRYLCDRQIKELKEACLLHEWNVRDVPNTIGCCLDGDRLDYSRGGLKIDPDYMCTPKGREMSKIINEIREKL